MFEITVIESGYFMADGGAMFGTIPKRLWSRSYPEVEDNLCRMAMRCVLATSPNRKILIDLGMGNKYLEQVSYYRPHGLNDINTQLDKLNIAASDITDVVLSHLHFDHCGYATHSNNAGEIVPTFENATYWISQKQWDNMHNHSLLEEGSIFVEDILPICQNGQLRFIEQDVDLYDGFRISLYDGHTPGQLVPVIDTQGGITAFPGDLIPTATHVSLVCISAYDLEARVSVEEKKRFLKLAVEHNYTLIYYHDAYKTSSKVKKVSDGYKADFST